MCSNGNEKYREMIKNFESHQLKMLKKENCAYEEKRENYDIGGIGLFFFFKIDI